MADETNEMTFEREPEEAVEAALCALLASVCTIEVEGALTPASEGTVKSLSVDTFVSVVVDQQSQDMDFVGRRVPHTYRAQIAVRYSCADDENAAKFRDECRRVRSALVSLTGDNCTNLGADGFSCDAFVIDSTSTSFEGGENPCNVKTYSATLKGRVTTMEA